MIRFHRSLVCVLAMFCLGDVSLESRPAVRFVAEASVLALEVNDQMFAAYAGSLWEEVGEHLANPDFIDDGETLEGLLSLRVHLAQFLGKDDEAVVTASWLRSLRDNAEERMLSGLLTYASVEARRRHAEREHGLDTFTDALRASVRAHFAGIPRTEALLGRMSSLRERLAAMTSSRLLKDYRSILDGLEGREKPLRLTLSEVDGLVKARHRLKNIAPYLGAIIEPIDEWIAGKAAD